MIFVKNTPNNTGAAIYGDQIDFENLYEALHTVVGDEDEYIAYEVARLRVLGICYDIRHALMGDREIEFVDNGMDDEKKKRMAVITPDKNVYLKIYVLWPELLFVTTALNQFLKFYAKRQAKTKYSLDIFTEKKVIWDSSIAQVRLLQSAVTECLKQTVSESIFARMLNIMNSSYAFFDRYLTQYLDILNHRFIKMDKEKRLKSLSSMAKRIVEPDQEYRDLKRQLQDEAKRHNCSVEDLRLNLEFPEDFDW